MKPCCSFCGEEFSEEHYPRSKCDCVKLWIKWLASKGAAREFLEEKLLDENKMPKFSGRWL